MLPILIRCCQPKTTKTLWVPKKAWFIAALAWTVFVTVLCLVSFSDLPHVNVGGVDKYIHAAFHFVFSMLWYMYLRGEDRAWGNTGTLFRVLALSLFFGILVEIAQAFFTDTRNADITDVGANFIGAITAIFLLYCYRKLTKRGVLN